MTRLLTAAVLVLALALTANAQQKNQMVKGTVKSADPSTSVLVIKQQVKNETVDRELSITSASEFEVTIGGGYIHSAGNTSAMYSLSDVTGAGGNVELGVAYRINPKLAVGLYGKTLLSQNGAPLRLVVPWKYGFKGIKGITKIRFVSGEPATTWNRMAPQEYGFYANVTPAVDHPRWSQAKERRIGEFLKRPTLPFNGYADQVAFLYAGMDLKRYF